MISTQDFERPKNFTHPRDSARLLFAPAMALAIALFAASPAWATGSVLSGMFDGSEPAIDSISGLECAHTPLGYVQSTFEVSASGTYYFVESLNPFGKVGVTALVYEGSFDASTPDQNLAASGGGREVTLSAGTTYVLVVQLMCTPAEGAWAISFSGPGVVLSDRTVEVPAFTSGVLTDEDPTMPNEYCGSGEQSPYRQSGPIQVSRDGQYYIANTAYYGLCMRIYTAPVDPADQDDNLVDAFNGLQSIELQARKDYYFVVQKYQGDAVGKYSYVLAPPAPFRVNRGLADSWYNPETPGQGFFLDIFEQRNEVFLGWFTYADAPVGTLPADDEFGHRWLTALGPFAGTSADLAIEWTGGGAFDSAQPIPEQELFGTIQLEFNDCTSGQITYSLDGDDITPVKVSGVIPIRRNVNDAVALCESIYAGPGMPGPL